MLECLVLWILNRIVIPTIKTFFYVTESSPHKNHVFFYRKPVWKRICQLAMSDLRSTMAQPLSKTEVQLLLSTGKTFGVPSMRLLPKSSGVRPIVNLASRRKDPLDMATGRAAQPVNQKLQDLFAVLNYEKVTCCDHFVGGCGHE
jgi:telomerase reverse transcriptase